MHAILINALDYSDVATSKLLKSLKMTKYPVLTVTGNKESTLWKEHEPNNFELQVPHNSIDLTGLIAIVENKSLILNKLGIVSEWFYMHATCECGKSFEIPFGDKISRPIKPDYNMNMGIYFYQDLLECKQLLDYRSTDNPSYNEVKELKKNRIFTEGIIFNSLKIGAPLTSHIHPKTIGPFDIYDTGSMRKIEYYEEIGLYKYKANWGQTTFETMVLSP